MWKWLPLYIVNTNLLVNGVTLKTNQKILKDGFHVEIHNVTTLDGFLLTIFRIPLNMSSKSPVLMLHGICGSSKHFLLNGKDSIAYALSEAGYDVWLGNSRGNTYSRKHIRWSTDSKPFWNFSFHEIGVFDTRAMIDYILENTSKKKLHFIGHSQGATSLVVLISENSEYKQKIQSSFMLAPAVYQNNSENTILKTMCHIFGAPNPKADVFGSFEITKQNDKLSSMVSLFCKKAKRLCDSIVDLVVGSSKNLRQGIYKDEFALALSGISVNQVFHFCQLFESGRFRMFDWGVARNLKAYGRSDPPDYKISEINFPTYIYFSDSDGISNHVDVKRFIEEITSARGKFLKGINWSHVDFVAGRDAKKKVYDDILRILNGF